MESFHFHHSTQYGFDQNLHLVDCRLTIWSSWSACTKSCGTGTTARTREIESEPENGGEECGDTKEMVECNTSLCPGRLKLKRNNVFAQNFLNKCQINTTEIF